MQFKLVAADPFGPQFEISLSSFPARLGRSLEAEVSLDDRWLSRYHCEIVEDDGQYVVRDLNSKHGTFINEQPIEEAPLRPGDELRIGLSRFIARFECPDRGNSDAQPSSMVPR